MGTAAEPGVPEASEAEQPLAKTCAACGQGTLQARVSAETPLSFDGEEFVRRYLMHVLPRGFQRVRYYGLFSHRQRAMQEQVRAALEGVDGRN